jgi:hypothetical protein
MRLALLGVCALALAYTGSQAGWLPVASDSTTVFLHDRRWLFVTTGGVVYRGVANAALQFPRSCCKRNSFISAP